MTALLLIFIILFSHDSLASVEGATLVRMYDDGKTQVLSPHIDVVANVFEEQLTINAGYAMDFVTSASSDVKTFASDTITDERKEIGTSVAFNMDQGSFGVGYLQSDEVDYHSKLYSMSASRNFFEKNTTIGLSFVYGDDNIQSSGDESYQEYMTNETYTLSLTQVLNALSVIQFLVDIRVESGVLNSPYRRARQETGTSGVYRGLQENLPRTRNRYAYTVKYNYFLKGLKAAWAQSLRIYHDSWGLLSGTLEERLTKQWGKLILATSLRYSHQEGASFYKDIYPTDIGPFYTGNKSLSTYDSYHFGLRPTFEFSHKFSFFLKGEYYIQNFQNHTDIGDINDSDDNEKLSIGAFIVGVGLDAKF